MTTREIYFKEVFKSDGCPMGMVGYLKKDNKRVIQLGQNACLELRTDEKVATKSIEQMNRIENEAGFMFWNSSTEGEKFFKENWVCISKHISNIVINQR
jgi:hypothetical protein